jgi:TonB family protein
MMEFLAYDLKVAVLVAVFYMFYRLLLSRETFHGVNRVVLLLTAVASFVLPLCVITIHKTVVLNHAEGDVAIGYLGAEVVDDDAMPFWQMAAIAIFFIGMIVTLGYTIMSVVRVWLLIQHSEHHQQTDGTVICVAPGDVSPFSWMKYIVLSRSDYEANDASILAHERGHIRRHHSLDLLLVDSLTALQWFNPAMWMLRQDLRAIHEYEADAAVLSQGINMRQYQYLLIQKAVSQCGYSVANGISHSTLKNRINMMLHKNSSRASLLKLLALTPIVGMTLALQAETVNDYVIEQPQNQTKVVKKGNQNAQVKVGTKKVEVKAAKPAAQAQTKAKKDATVKNVVVKAKKDAPTVSNVVVKTKKDPLAEGEVAIGVIDNDKDDRVWDVVEQMPKFPGGDGALMDFLHKSIKYPAEAEKAGKQGRVVVVFVVGKDGAVNNAKVVRSVDEKLDAEALRVVNAMPKWQPGKQNGQDVNVKFTIPVTFKLNKPAEKK